jgi:hypothetical protein
MFTGMPAREVRLHSGGATAGEALGLGEPVAVRVLEDEGVRELLLEGLTVGVALARHCSCAEPLLPLP